MNLETQAKQTIEKYNLIERKEKVVVALSGGKDSTTVLYILHKLGYNVSGLMIDLHLGEWSRKNKENVEKFCLQLGVGLTVVDLKKELGQGICFIKEILKKQRGLTGCSVCGVIKKWILNKYAKKLGADKIATGHNLDDECQTILMNFLKGNIKLGINSSPATGIELNGNKSTCFSSDGELINNKDYLISESTKSPKLAGFAQRIKPLFFIPEDEIKKYSKKMNFPVLYERCPCAIGTYRVETRNWMNGISNKEKLKIVENWLKIIPKLRKNEKIEIRECKKCGEPCKNDICQFCKITDGFR